MRSERRPHLSILSVYKYSKGDHYPIRESVPISIISFLSMSSLAMDILDDIIDAQLGN